MAKTKNQLKRFIQQTRNSRYQTVAAIIVVITATVLGYFLFIASHATSPYATIEAESGTLSGSACTVSGDSTASGNSYVSFGGSACGTGSGGGYIIPTCTQYCGGTKYGAGNATTMTVKDSIGTGHTVWVYRPPVPDSASLPILYFLGGMGDTWQQPATNLKSDMDNWLANGGMPFVMVCPDGSPDDPSVHITSMWANSIDGKDPIETLVTTQVIQAVEGSNRRDSARRAIAGFSMGGYGAANIALRNPGLYGQVGPLAGFFSNTNNGFDSGVFYNSNGTLNTAADAANTPDNNIVNAPQMRWFVSDASDDTHTSVNTESPPFIALLKSKGAYVQSNLTLTGGHSWTYVAEAYPIELKTVIVPGWGGSSGNN